MAIAVIPARGGSKGVPRKNLRQIDGKPLIVRAIEACLDAKTIDEVLVSTEDEEIAGVARKFDCAVVTRPVEIAGDNASSESAVLHALETFNAPKGSNAKVVALVQATSPFTRAHSIDQVVSLVEDGSWDTVFTAVVGHPFLWHRSSAGSLVPQDRESIQRKPRQDIPEAYIESGGVYATLVNMLRESGTRFNGRIAGLPVDQVEAIEIDTVENLEFASLVARGLSSTN